MDGFKWEDIAEILRERIAKGELKGGEDFPTNFELMQEFKVHSGTIQNTVNALIREGLVSSHGSGMARRKVRSLLERTARNCNIYSRINSNNEQFIIEDKKIIHSAEELPEKMLTHCEVKFPSLRIQAKIYRKKAPIALSDSLFSGYIPAQKLYRLLKDPNMELDNAMTTFGFKPTYCIERLLSSIPTLKEKKILKLATQDLTPVLQIRREVYDDQKNLLELRYMVLRGDCYENIYHIPINNKD